MSCGNKLEPARFTQLRMTLIVPVLNEQDLEVICKHAITKTDINKFKISAMSFRIRSGCSRLTASLSSVASSFR